MRQRKEYGLLVYETRGGCVRRGNVRDVSICELRRTI